MINNPAFWIAYAVASLLTFYVVSGIWMSGPVSTTGAIVSFLLAVLLIAVAEVILE